MNTRPILSAMLRNKTEAMLVALQCAVTMAVIVNAMFIVQNRIAHVSRDNGMDTDNIFVFQSWGFKESYQHESTVREDVAVIGDIRGVRAVTPINGAPLSGGGSAQGYDASDDDDAHEESANYYTVTEQGVSALGVELIAGRDFRADEIVYQNEDFAGGFSKVVIVTKAFADDLYGEGIDPLGKLIYAGTGEAAEIIGVVSRMHGAWVNWDDLDHVVLMPLVRAGPFGRYLVRVEDGELARVMSEVEDLLAVANGDRLVRKFASLREIADSSYRGDVAMSIMLAMVVGLLLIVTALGIVGLAAFSVKQRTKQIGTRRAVGARQRDILSYFLTENWLMMTMGVALGTVLTLLLNYHLATQYELERIDPVYLPVGIMTMWLLGLLAVFGPARRAARISPAIATRTV